MYKIKEHDLCTFCNAESETVKHLLCECKYVQQLWKFIESKCNDKRCKWDSANILLNTVTSNPGSVENCITLVTKQYIYVTQCFNQKPAVSALKSYIEQFKNAEEIIAENKNKIDHHKNKWTNWCVM